MVVAETIAGLGALKTAFDMAKGLESIHETVARDRAVIELQKEILAAQSAQAALVEAVGALKGRVAELEAWDADKKRYKLTDVGDGLLAYSIKEGMDNGEPLHYLCANCYNNGIKSILQKELRNPGRCDVLTCHHCGSDLYVVGTPYPEHFKNRSRR